MVGSFVIKTNEDAAILDNNSTTQTKGFQVNGLLKNYFSATVHRTSYANQTKSTDHQLIMDNVMQENTQYRPNKKLDSIPRTRYTEQTKPRNKNIN